MSPVITATIESSFWANLAELIGWFFADSLAIFTLTMAAYARPTHRASVAPLAILFNFGGFISFAVADNVLVGAAIWVGLFAVLALFRLRGEPFSLHEALYFAGALAIAGVHGRTGRVVSAVALSVACISAMLLVAILASRRSTPAAVDREPPAGRLPPPPDDANGSGRRSQPRGITAVLVRAIGDGGRPTAPQTRSS